jgi:EAL domain-containing protein (putative c-di-GMP-specific phosphodiesterase class I)
MEILRPTGCSRCESLPEPCAGPGRLFLWFPIRHSQAQAARHLEQLGRGTRALPAGDGLQVDLFGEEALDLARSLAEQLGPEEANDTRVLWKPGGDDPGFADFPRVTSLQRFVAAGRAGWLRDLLADGRYTSHFQPIVNAADAATVFGHEALLRGFGGDNEPIPPGRIFDAARESGLLFQLDLAARQSAIRQAVRHGLRTRIFVNFTPASIYDPAYCLRSTVAAVTDSGLPPYLIVFEVIESERVDNVAHLESILAVYRQAGFRVALDDLGSGYSSLTLMGRIRPDFVKLDRELIRHVDRDPYKAAIAAKLLELAKQLKVRTIAEGVETAGELAWLRRHGADYVQGFLIAPPAEEPARALPVL